MLRAMTVLDILPPSGLRRFVALYLDTVSSGLRRLGRGGALFNAPSARANGVLVLLKRLLRFALLILACHLVIGPAKARTVRASQPAPVLRTLRFRLFPVMRRNRYDDEPLQAQPDCFARGERDAFLRAQRRLAMLARVIAAPSRYVAHMARRLPARLFVMGVRPARRTPDAERRDVWETLVGAWAEAWHQLHEFRRRTRDSVAVKASAS